MNLLGRCASELHSTAPAGSAWPVVDEPEAVEPPLRRKPWDAKTGVTNVLVAEQGGASLTGNSGSHWADGVAT